MPNEPVPRYTERINADDPDSMAQWCEKLGITMDQLEESVLAVGNDPNAVLEHLLQQGSSAGAG